MRESKNLIRIKLITKINLKEYIYKKTYSVAISIFYKNRFQKIII